MKRVLLILASLLALSSANAKGLASPEQLDHWITYYYLDPAPSEIPEALRAVSARGFFENDNVQAPLSGFFTGVFKANPDKLREWVKPYIGVPRRHIIYSALWMANSKEAKAALEELAKGAAPSEATQLRKLAASTPPTIESMAIDSAASLDYLWGYFMASGSEAPVLRIIDQIKLVNAKGNVAEMLIGGAAQWSVSANARQHERVLDIVRARAKTADPETRASLQKILSDIAAERAKK